MKFTKYLLISLMSLLIMSACSPQPETQNAQTSYQCPMKCEGDKVSSKEGACPVCKMDLMPIKANEHEEVSPDEISEMSIFNLKSKWYTEENEEILLEHLKGKTTVMVMIYTTCKAACPRLVADMRSIESKIIAANRTEVQYVLVSINPETDTPEVLKSFAIENEMDGEQWTFLQGTTADVRELSNVLAVKYKEISPIDFSHSNIITVFDDLGEMVHQQEGLGVDNEETVAVIIETAERI